jgi:Trypsin-co-occurring domain 1
VAGNGRSPVKTAMCLGCPGSRSRGAYDLRVNTKLTDLRFGDQTVTVAAVLPSGSESTSAADKIRGRAVDALEQAGSAIDAVAKSTVETASRLRKAAMAPASVEVELGLAFTVQGGVIVAGGGVQASIVVHLTYELADKNGSA